MIIVAFPNQVLKKDPRSLTRLWASSNCSYRACLCWPTSTMQWWAVGSSNPKNVLSLVLFWWGCPVFYGLIKLCNMPEGQQWLIFFEHVYVYTSALWRLNEIFFSGICHLARRAASLGEFSDRWSQDAKCAISIKAFSLRYGHTVVGPTNVIEDYKTHKSVSVESHRNVHNEPYLQAYHIFSQWLEPLSFDADLSLIPGSKPLGMWAGRRPAIELQITKSLSG